MHAQTIDDFRHEHVFLGASHERNERRTWLVIGLCGAMMAAEIGGGALFNSMALIADGLHMSTHAGALLIAALAYTFARRHARDQRFSFGTGKFGELAAFASAIVLAMIALLIGYESVERLLHPVRIALNQAIPIAFLGLGVNLASAWLLRDDHDHHHGHGHAHAQANDDDDHDHGHEHDHHHHDRDLNLRAAYVHVMADAAVSVLAIVGLTSAKLFGFVWMDPVMGVVGSLVIANWSFGLVRAAGAVLLDMQPDGALAHAIEHRLEDGADRISDLHLWRVGPGHNAAVVSLVSDHPQPPEAYKAKLAGLASLSHVTVEVHACPGAHPA
ncbi:MAG TPA: CDF family Co(II)/Ni(II) efflux transporter DmeF, partial [Caulobacteraceae bacterium]|nr:CDF family Co(II)/Ni(II) efflux transporter DmeF [Caulobacteraceae bacterium]